MIKRKYSIMRSSIRVTCVICLYLICSYVYSQVTSNISYSTGTSVDVGIGADICSDEIIIDGTFSGNGTICSGTLPVSISSFNFSVNKRDVTLIWVTEWELNNKGFDIERKDGYGNNANWKKIAFINGNGTITEHKQYNFIDEKLLTGKYKYRLKQLDYNGNYEYFNLNDEVVIMPPKNFDMTQNYPNPGNPNCKINFEIPIDGNVLFKIYDLLGREIATLIDEYRKAGYYIIEFDGSKYASGVYFYTLESGSFKSTKKMILLK